MDILGIGAGELVLIALLMLVIAGPKRSAMWAREAGQYLRKFRQTWQTMMDELNKEIGDDGKEFMNAAQEIAQVANDFRRAANPKQIVQKALTAAEKSDPQPHPATESQPAAENGSSTAGRYGAWTLSSDESDTGDSSSTD